MTGVAGIRSVPYRRSTSSTRSIGRSRSSLEHEIDRVGRDARILAAHDAGDYDGLLRVGDHEHPAVQVARFPVQGRDFFVIARAPDDNLLPTELAGIEGVHGLAGFEHDVVA